MSGGSDAELTGTTGQNLLALFVVVVMAAVGGILVQIMLKGINFTSGKVGPVNIKPLLTKVQIPPLVGMIVFGCLARNYLCSAYMDHYPEIYASWIRSICLSVILLRGGMELDFTGKGLLVVLLTLVPQNAEAIGAALATRWIFSMPWPLCFGMGYTLGAVSPAVLVPSCMILHKNDYGVKKGIPTSLIAAASFDDIIAISIFSIFMTIALTEAPGGEDEEGKNIWFELGYVIIQIVVGLILAFAVGFAMKIFNRWSPEKTKWPKFFVTVFFAIAAPIVAELVHFPESKFIFIIFYGYTCYRVWGEDKPEHELALFWMFCQPFLFGTVGAAVLFSNIEPSLIGKSFGVIVIGVAARWIFTFLAGCGKKFNNKERAFMAFAWIPKATVQAALGGVCLAEAKKRNIPLYEDYGVKILTTAVFAICLTAPLGAIMINTLGTKWLEYDGNDPKELAKQRKTS